MFKKLSGWKRMVLGLVVLTTLVSGCCDYQGGKCIHQVIEKSLLPTR